MKLFIYLGPHPSWDLLGHQNIRILKHSKQPYSNQHIHTIIFELNNLFNNFSFLQGSPRQNTYLG